MTEIEILCARAWDGNECSGPQYVVSNTRCSPPPPQRSAASRKSCSYLPITSGLRDIRRW